MRPEDIIIKPIITEESNAGIQEGKYTFKVNKKATKVDVANAVEKLFGVKVLRVNTITVVTIDTNPSDKTYLAKGGKETKIATKYKTSIDEFMGA